MSGRCEGQCVFCGRVTNLTAEHVLPASIGGELTVVATCVGCNRQSSHDFEAGFLNSLKPFCHLLGVGNRAGRVPSVEIKVNMHGRELGAVLSPRLDLTVQDSVIEQLDDQGKTQREYWMFSRNGAEKLKTRAARRGQEVVPITGAGVPVGVKLSSSIALDFLSEAAARRTAAKIAFLYLAYKGGLALANAPAYDSIRDFIVHGSGQAVRLFTNRDFSKATPLNAFQHFLMVASDTKTGCIAAVVVLFGGLGYVVNLASGASVDFGSTYVWYATTAPESNFWCMMR